ncbi:response regulator [Prosthecobacter sp.]|uniref:response regulator n=1 Tax=Prosthecobacter sp. TaxID=1965333 RepID=UPI001DECD4F5|nr:response regulator [Prosthecobacter sp.]MCB1278012.1 response regulator [Prosthecobacter sp.]
MYLNTAQPIAAIHDRILIVSPDPPAKEDLLIAYALQNSEPDTGTSALNVAKQHGDRNRTGATQLEVVCSAHESEALVLIENGLRQQAPFFVVFIDGRLFHGKEYRSIVQRFWKVQRNLHIVIHSVSQMSGFEQIPVELGPQHRLLVLKYRLVPFEITQIARTLADKQSSEDKTVYREIDLKAQLLAATTQFEDASNRLRVERDRCRQLEEQLCRSQRYETVGRFADSMAHFFNNYLTVIQGYLDMARAVQAGDPDQEARLEKLYVATKHTADVTSQFVSFNRRDYLQPKPSDLARIIDSQAALLQKALGESIVIQIKHKPDIPAVLADPACLEQTLFSVLIHARDAMPNGGRLMIQTHEMNLADEASARRVNPKAMPGHYVVIVISDNGKGMAPAEVAGMFDSSRLLQDSESRADLAMILAQGRMHLQRGWIGISSVQDVGTEYRIYLPAVRDAACLAGEAGPESNHTGAQGDGTTILIADDEESVRLVMEYVLTSQGHQVLVAKDATQAWDLWRKHSSLIQLVITDIQMPGGSSGFDLEKAITDMDPTVPVILTCGYCSTKFPNAIELREGENFLSKPFGMVELLNIVGRALQSCSRL